MTDGSLKDDISAKERLGKFMEFLPRRLCIRVSFVKDPEYSTETFFARILYVGITGVDMAQVSETLSCDTKVSSLGSARYTARHDSPDGISQTIALVLHGWESSLNTAWHLWLEPKEFVGIQNHEGTNEFGACEASNPRLMLYYGLLASRIDLAVHRLESVAGMNSKIREDLRALKGLGQRFNAFVAQTQRDLI